MTIKTLSVGIVGIYFTVLLKNIYFFYIYTAKARFCLETLLNHVKAENNE